MGAIWCSFYTLVLWAGIYIKGLPDLLHYVDDAFSFEPDKTLEFYPPYDKWFPRKQFRLLQLFDKVGIPHEKGKQEFRCELTIVGLQVSLDSMTITMPFDKCANLIEEVNQFIQSSVWRHPLQDWQQLLGYCNWALNAYPLLQPAFQSSYAKLRGKTIPLAPIRLNRSVIQDLNWFSCRISTSAGVNFLDAHHWSEEDAEITLFTDASGVGLAFWSPEVESAVVGPIKESNSCYGNIFFNEALAVVSAIEWAAHLPDKLRHVLIHTDSMNTVDIFHSLAAKPNYEIMMDFGVDVRVIHIPGVENIVADALSRLLFPVASAHQPGLRISTFQPPRDELGARRE